MSGLLERKNKVLSGMIRYLQFGGATGATDPDFDPSFQAGYTRADVDRCAEILDAFLQALAGGIDKKSDEKILAVVHTTVRALNELNQDCEETLIETSEREDLLAFIESAAREAGLETEESDITYEWRQW
jgi:hypothetical protein